MKGVYFFHETYESLPPLFYKSGHAQKIYNVACDFFKIEKCDIEKLVQDEIYIGKNFFNQNVFTFLNSLIKFYNEEVEKKIEIVAGYSSGEIASLVVANVISLKDGLKIIITRTKEIEKIQKKINASSIVVKELLSKEVNKICQETYDLIWVSAINSKDEVIITGTTSGVSFLKEKSFKKNDSFKSFGVHTPIMHHAETSLQKIIDKISFKEPIYSIYQNFTGKKSLSVDEIKSNLKKQLTSPIRWEELNLNLEKDLKSE